MYRTGSKSSPAAIPVPPPVTQVWDTDYPFISLTIEEIEEIIDDDDPDSMARKKGLWKEINGGIRLMKELKLSGESGLPSFIWFPNTFLIMGNNGQLHHFFAIPRDNPISYTYVDQTVDKGFKIHHGRDGPISIDQPEIFPDFKSKVDGEVRFMGGDRRSQMVTSLTQYAQYTNPLLIAEEESQRQEELMKRNVRVIQESVAEKQQEIQAIRDKHLLQFTLIHTDYVVKEAKMWSPAETEPNFSTVDPSITLMEFGEDETTTWNFFIDGDMVEYDPSDDSEVQRTPVQSFDFYIKHEWGYSPEERQFKKEAELYFPEYKYCDKVAVGRAGEVSLPLNYADMYRYLLDLPHHLDPSECPTLIIVGKTEDIMDF